MIQLIMVSNQCIVSSGHEVTSRGLGMLEDKDADHPPLVRLDEKQWRDKEEAYIQQWV